MKTGNFYKKISVLLFVANFFSFVFFGNMFSHYGEYNWAAFFSASFAAHSFVL